MYIYESDYYQGLIEKANLTNPTELVSEGLDITVQDACINRTLSFCKMTNEYFFPNVLARTNGQLNLVSSSYPELGISGTDNLGLIADGTLGMAIVAGAYVAGEVPALDISFLEGLYPDRETMFNALSALVPDLKQLHEDATGGDAIVILINWSPGDDRYFFSQKPLSTVEDFEGMKVRAFGTTISDWIIGMGASAQFVAFAEVYTALERGILDAGVTGASPAYGQRWYEVTKYMNGPLVNFPIVPTMINRAVWEEIPPDLQQIMIEESAKTELEMLRVSSIHNEIILEKSIKAGLEFVEFSPEVRERSNAALIERVVPNWVKRAGGGDQPVIELFNEHIGERIGMHVNPDGTVVKAPITK
jgi:TRAP-type C4-dicarboxylate transport system substrate-binding protein